MLLLLLVTCVYRENLKYCSRIFFKAVEDANCTYHQDWILNHRQYCSEIVSKYHRERTSPSEGNNTAIRPLLVALDILYSTLQAVASECVMVGTGELNN